MTDELRQESKKKRKPRTVKLTLKQRKLVKVAAETGNVSEAGRQAGYSNAPTAHRALKAVRLRFEDYLEKHGITDDYLAQKCANLMEAKKIEFFAKEGIVTDQREVEALDIRLRAVDMMHKIKGNYRQPEDAGNNSRSQAHTVCVVVAEPQEAAAIARFLAPGGAAGVVVDMDAAVHKDVG